MNVLDNSNDGSYHDECADDVEHVKMFLPGEIWGHRSMSWVSKDTLVEEEGDEHKDTEEDNLNEEPCEDNPFSCLDDVDILVCLQAAAWRK